MKKAKYFLSAMLMAACFTQPAKAQFEGSITYESTDYTSVSNEDDDSFTLHLTPDRMLLEGDKSYNFLESIKTEGVLVRLDKEDFVFLTGGEQALKISKTDITSMMNLFNGGQDVTQQADNVDITQKRTGETKDIQGFQADEFIFKNNDENENKHFAVWMTRDIDVNWGMLAEPWDDADQLISSTDFPVDLVFKEKYFPLRFESYEDDELKSVLEATKIDKGPVDTDKMQVPAGVNVLSMQNYLFQKLSEN